MTASDLALCCPWLPLPCLALPPAAERFDEWFQMEGDSKEGEAEVVNKLHKVLRPFLLRRLKSDVEKSLPPKKETILKIGMSEMQVILGGSWKGWNELFEKRVNCLCILLLSYLKARNARPTPLHICSWLSLLSPALTSPSQPQTS